MVYSSDKVELKAQSPAYQDELAAFATKHLE